jgi:hypothetical protein
LALVLFVKHNFFQIFFKFFFNFSRYLTKQREDMLRNEYGDNIPANLITPPIGPQLDSATKAKQDDLQSRILDILNKRKVAENPAVSSMGTHAMPELSASLQKAIDSLIKTGPNLLNNSAAAAAAATTSAGGSGGQQDYLFSAYGGRGGGGGGGY